MPCFIFQHNVYVEDTFRPLLCHRMGHKMLMKLKLNTKEKENKPMAYGTLVDH